MSKKFTPAEEKIINDAVQKLKNAQRAAEIESEIRNRMLDDQRKQPGYTGY